MISLVIVSHSAQLAAGVVELAREMAGPEVQIAAAGGLDLPGAPLGTDAALVLRAVRQVYSDAGVLVLMDLGSALLAAEMALEQLPPEERAHVALCSAPLVEGAVIAAVQARLGQPLAQVADEARGALDTKRVQLGEVMVSADTGGPGPAEILGGPEIRLVVRDPHGLHARPAARFLRTAACFQAGIALRNLTTGRGPVSAASIKDVMGLDVQQGHELQVIASGPEAGQALAALEVLARNEFGDGDPFTETPMAAVRGPVQTTGSDRGPSPGCLQGLPASGGVAVGPARFLEPVVPVIPTTRASDPQDEWDRLVAALGKTRQQIELQREHMACQAQSDMASLFDAHLLLLEDASLQAAARRGIFELGQNGAQAWHLTVEQVAAEYAVLENAYLRARAVDVKEVGRRVLANLLDEQAKAETFDEPGILIAAEPALAEIADLGPGLVQGICAGQGSPSSHVAILARNLGIPAVLALGEGLSRIPAGTTLIVDGDEGTVWVEPAADRLEDYRRRVVALKALQERAREGSGGQAATRDGHGVEVAANIGSTAEARAAVVHGAEGVGLYRTEFLFLGRQTAPGEEEQFETYRAAARILDGRPLIIRTFDIGGDKVAPCLALKPEVNPFLGLRGLRLSLRQPDVFGAQLRAILRVSALFPVKIMFPMVSTPGEWREAIRHLAEAQAEVRRKGLSLPPGIETGIMIEVPAAALSVVQFAPHVDFFSIGSNDLTQYTMAAERGNPEVAALADSLDPAVLHLIERVVAAAHANRKWVGVCGEMAGDPVALPLLVGLGVDELSMNPSGIPRAKEIIRGLDFGAAQDMAKTALTLESAEAVRALENSGVASATGGGTPMTGLSACAPATPCGRPLPI